MRYRKDKMEIRGKYLAWSIIHLIFFINLVFVDYNAETLDQWVFIIILYFIFGGCFIKNTEKAFVKNEPKGVRKR